MCIIKIIKKDQTLDSEKAWLLGVQGFFFPSYYFRFGTEKVLV